MKVFNISSKQNTWIDLKKKTIRSFVTSLRFMSVGSQNKNRKLIVTELKNEPTYMLCYIHGRLCKSVQYRQQLLIEL